MEITLLIKLFFILIVVLAVLMFFLFKIVKARKKKLASFQQVKQVKKERKLDLKDLRDIIKNKKISSKKLQETLDLVIKDYGVIKDFDIYTDIILRITRHPSTTKDIILSFDRELSKLNPKYKSLISNNVTNGLNSRRV